MLQATKIRRSFVSHLWDQASRLHYDVFASIGAVRVFARTEDEWRARVLA